MRASGGALFSLGLAALAGYAVVAAWSWPLKAALFPLVIGVPLFILALVQVFLLLSHAARLGGMDTLDRARRGGVGLLPPAVRAAAALSLRRGAGARLAWFMSQTK
jgi:hypothetical protein